MAIIVNENDAIIEYRKRRDVGRYDLHRIVAVWITDAQGNVLIAQRAHTMSNQPGLWGPVAAGTVAMGEEYHDTAARELAEEVGITGIRLVQVGKFRTDCDFGECRMCAVFAGQYNDNIESLTLQREEVAAVRWVNLPQLRQELTQHPEDFVINMQNVLRSVATA